MYGLKSRSRCGVDLYLQEMVASYRIRSTDSEVESLIPTLQAAKYDVPELSQSTGRLGPLRHNMEREWNGTDRGKAKC